MNSDKLKYMTPLYEVTIKKDVWYRTARGYWTEGPDHTIPPAAYWSKPVEKPKPLKLKMDIFTPQDDVRDKGQNQDQSHTTNTRPLLLMMHGGAYLIGSKNEKGQQEWCKFFASLGYVAAAIDYRLGFPITKNGILKAESDALEDARAALGFLLNQSDLQIDPNRVFVAGTSAGGALALGLAYGTETTPAASSAATLPCRIRAIGNLWGYVRDLDILKNASVPIISFQSKHDPIVPYQAGYPMGIHLAGRTFGTEAIHERAKALGIPSEHVPCPEKAHRLHLDKDGALTSRFYDIRDALASFFARNQ